MSAPYTPLDVHEFKRRWEEGWRPFVFDVRSQAEADEVSLPFTDRLEPHTGVAGIASELPRDREIVIYCRSGGRSGMACSVLAQRGFTGLYNREGGMLAWVGEFGRP